MICPVCTCWPVVDADRRAVGIQRFQPAAMVDLDVVTVAAAPTVKAVGNGNCSVRGGENRRTPDTGNVGTGVGADLTGDWVNAVAELRGNRTLNRQRPLQGSCRVWVPSGNISSPPSLCKTTEQFCLQFLTLWVLQ